jgi:hypothetical protein
MSHHLNAGESQNIKITQYMQYTHIQNYLLSTKKYIP